MKIGILTQPVGYNYGGIMQNYALQSVLRKEEHHALTLHRESRKDPDRSLQLMYLSYLRRRYLRKEFVDIPQSIFFRRYNAIINKAVGPFLKKYIALTARISDSTMLLETVMNEGLEAIVVGSDQVWRPKFSPAISDFFLSFLPENAGIKRIAYAASFGTNEWEFSLEESEMARKNIKYFDAISVREESAVNLCKDYLGMNATFVLDPTLLLSKDEYVRNLGLSDNRRRGKVFAYLLDVSPEKEYFAHSISKKLGTTYYEIMPKLEVPHLWRNFFNYEFHSVEAWLESILGAEFVVTDSFHGAVFSIIFGKPFVVIENKARGTARFDTLKKFVSPYSFIDEESMNDYQLKKPVVDQVKLDQLKQSSLQFLRNALS